MRPSPTIVRHLYVHVPYCDGKCLYCAFFSESVGNAPTAAHKAFAALPARELALLLRAGLPVAPHTIYVGGGTPAALGMADLQRLIQSLLAVVPTSELAEFTVELTPQLVTVELLRMLRRYGVNRVSMGAQCFDDAVLRRMRRRHTVADTIAAVALIREAGFTNFGLDLIAGLPGVDAVGWQQGIQRVIGLDLPHVSVYALMVEAGSALADMARQGMPLPDDDALLQALAQAGDMLEAAGYGRYEISNYARPGYECRHNLAYWQGADYLGLGPAAASRLGDRRRANAADTAAYSAAVASDTLPAAAEEVLSAAEDMAERFIFNLRLGAGVVIETFCQKFPQAQPWAPQWQQRLVRLAASGVVTCTADHCWCLTARGREVADAVCRELIDA